MDIVERVARAIRDAHGDVNDPDPDGHWRGFQTDARAAMEAMREPSEEMIEAGWRRLGGEESGVYLSDVRGAWLAMVDEALK